MKSDLIYLSIIAHNRVFPFLCLFLLTRIVGDNVDLEQRARIQSHKTTNKSLHWFQIYAVKDRVTSDKSLSDHPQKSLADLQMREFLPTQDVHSSLLNDFTIIIPRILIQYLPAYKPFMKAVNFHIPHAHSAEMLQKSEVVCVQS